MHKHRFMCSDPIFTSAKNTFDAFDTFDSNDEGLSLGDQIGRIFVYWLTVFFGKFGGKLQKLPKQ
jgi:hypothetical protein